MDAALIDALIEKFAALIAALAVEATPLPRLAHVHDLFFEALVDELYTRHDIPQPVLADTVSMTTRGLQTRLASRRGRDRGLTISRKLLDHLDAHGSASRAELEHHLRHEHPRHVSSALRMLVRDSVLKTTGHGPAARYERNRGADFDPQAHDSARLLAWVAIHDNPDSTLAELVDILGVGRPHREALGSIVAELVEEGMVEARPADGGEPEPAGVRFRARDFVFSHEQTDARHAAIYDHVSAVVDVLLMESRAHRGQPDPHDGPVGGNTFRFDIWPDDPPSREATGTLKRLRAELSALRARIDAERPTGEAPVGQVTVYIGSATVESEEDGADRTAPAKGSGGSADARPKT